MPGYDQFPHVHCQSLLNLILAECLTKYENKTLINVNTSGSSCPINTHWFLSYITSSEKLSKSCLSTGSPKA